MSEETGKKMIVSLIKSAKKHGFKKLLLRFAGGESMLEFEKIIKLIHYAKDTLKNSQLIGSFVVLTNGTLLTPERVKILKKENVHVFLSLDGLGKIHDLTRPFFGGKGSFEYVKKGLELLLESKVSCNVSVVVTKNNIDQLPELTEWLMRKNIIITFNFLRDNYTNQAKKDLTNERLIKGMKIAYKVIEKYQPTHSLMNTILDALEFSRPRSLGCGIGSSYVAIRQDGSVSDCQMTLFRSVGNIKDDVVGVIRSQSQIRPLVSSDQKIGCRDCRWKYICGGGCIISNYKALGRFDVPSPYCNVYKALIPEVLKIEAKRLIKYGQS